LDKKLPICKAQKILKPECTIVHEASFKIWQDFAATKQMGEFVSFAPLRAVQTLTILSGSDGSKYSPAF
jgi:hypothetical protein